ncbi:MAG: type II toxin-antitoxin system VapC family toxin [Rhodospirillaceae bacterium]|nr:type II toxin-antitoxin system VapC family toxin [Rhodospirillaceae bacterium]
MSAVLVDSNVLIDIATLDPVWASWSAEQVETIARHHRLVINPVIYAEATVSFGSIDEADSRLPLDMVGREPIPFEAAFLAGKAFAAYRRRGGERTSLLPDFLIGAHAAVRGHRILTRDDRRYRAFFPSVRLIVPRRRS